MFRYLREYRIADMKEMMQNTRTPHLRSQASLAGKTAVITGATSGVGLSAAQELARFGGDLVLVARNERKVKQVIQELQGSFGCRAQYVIADFKVLKEVKLACKQIIDEVDRIDILINSAGIHSTRKRYTEDGMESVFCVNYLASFILTHRLIPKMKRQASARIIQVSSQGHRFNGFNVDDLNWEKRLYTGLRGYGASKTAQLLSMWEFAERLEGTSVVINAMHPGEVRTNIGSNNGPLYAFYHDKLLWKLLKDVKISGESIHYLAADERVAGITGKYFNLTHLEKPAPHALDRAAGAVLWKKTLEMTGLPDEV